MHNPPHPGEVLREYLGDSTIDVAAARLGIDSEQLERIIAGATAVSPELASRLGMALNTSPELWVRMQAQYDLRMRG
ncbi:HigA family addiction module antitoxin [Massilia sp. UYP11]|uniref:HigA family addiction module antitoxin n=1 Tax=Massilia sp. UYP11 TaxID=1756385 RepID=UPI003D240EC9